MKKCSYLAELLLVAELTAVSLIALLVKVFRPTAILPRLNGPALVLLSLIPLVLTQYLNLNRAPVYVRRGLTAGLAFSLLPRCVGLGGDVPLWGAFLGSAALFLITQGLYVCMEQRCILNPRAPLAPMVNALGLYLASQCLL